MAVESTMPQALIQIDQLRRRRQLQYLAQRALIYALLLLGALIILVPFFWMVSTSLKVEKHLFDQPPQWIPDPIAPENYIEAWEKLASIAPGLTFWRILGNTLFITGLAMFAEMFSASLVAYGFARFEFKGRDVIFFIMLSTMMIPATLTRVPTFLIWKRLGLLNTYDPMTVPAWFAWGPAYVFLLRQFLLTIPRDFEEAAYIDGANVLQVFVIIMLPLIKPALLALAVLIFQGNWNNFMGPLIYLNSVDQFPMVMALKFFQESLSKEAPKWHYMMAMSTVMAAPLLLLYFMAQRYFIEGLTIGGVKG